MEILGLERLTFSSPEFTPLITTASDKDRTRFKETADFIQRLLKSRYPNGLTFQEITDAIRTRFEIGSLSDDKIRALLRCVKNIEKVGQRCSIREGRVRRRADHYEQILLQAGKPLHYRVLARRAVRFGFYGAHGTSRPVKAILGNDSRFAPIGKSGFWALTRWRNVDTRILTEIAADEIQRAGRPLHEDELYSSIVKRRPVKRISIGGTLSKSSRFKKMGVKLWTIRE